MVLTCDVMDGPPNFSEILARPGAVGALFPGRLLFVKNSRSPAGAAAKPPQPENPLKWDIK
jgi:hypothetical protein